jgi:hypothetical protein
MLSMFYRGQAMSGAAGAFMMPRCVSDLAGAHPSISATAARRVAALRDPPIKKPSRS